MVFYTVFITYMVFTAVITLYYFQKVARKLHLSKTRMQEFMDQGSTMPFYMAIVGGAFYVFIKVSRDCYVHFGRARGRRGLGLHHSFLHGN